MSDAFVALPGRPPGSAPRGPLTRPRARAEAAAGVLVITGRWGAGGRPARAAGTVSYLYPLPHGFGGARGVWIPFLCYGGTCCHTQPLIAFQGIA